MRWDLARLGSRWLWNVLAAIIVAAALSVWLWPIGLGGQMPIGGDVTNFFLGLMTVLGESLQHGRLAVWNDLWGYGFPGLAESQMGVYYPPHIVLYGYLKTETAYVVSLVLHTVWGGLGAFWASRVLGVSRTGSSLAAFSWSASGFFLIHLAHPWGYTTGCWMPWAWGLAWLIMTPDCGRAVSALAPSLLSLVLVLQVLPGHFQVAFLTQFGIVLILVWAFFESVARHGSPPISGLPRGAPPIWKRAGAVVLTLAAVLPLAALQLWPTARLARLAAGQRDFEYLSGFASTPFHLVNYVAPGLFHRSPLWRPLVWTPFHTSPEESLSYVGLIPLFLAIMTILRESRRDPAVRLLTLLAAVTMFLSFGPYVPGFRLLISLPGFSFFRAPSRWNIATALALAILAGKGFDRWGQWRHPGRSLVWCTVAALVWTTGVLGLIELGLMSTARPGWPRVVSQFERAFRAMPWTEEPGFSAVMALARKHQPDPHVPAGLPPSVVLKKTPTDASFAGRRAWVYASELGETAALLLSILTVVALRQRGRISPEVVPRLLLLITFFDLWTLGRHRLLDVAPLRPLTEQSSVLARLSREPRGTRIADDEFRNLPMLIGLAPISAYRTLNLPAVESLTALARGPINDPRFNTLVEKALRATGTGVQVADPVRNRVERLLGHAGTMRELVDDPVLPTWLYNTSWTAEQGAWIRSFSIWRSKERPARAWFVSDAAVPKPGIMEEWSGDPAEILEIFDHARPLEAEFSNPGEWTIFVDRDEEQASVIVSQLNDPQWQARWVGLDAQGSTVGEILPAFRKKGEPGGWQRVEIPGTGRWKLLLHYDARDVAEGVAISVIAWLSWTLLAVSTLFRTWFGRPAPTPSQAEA